MDFKMPDYRCRDESREECSQNLQGVEIYLNCRTIRIGSYRYTPKEKVHISVRGIKIVAPSLKNESQEVALQISLKEIVKILVHFGKGLPVLFLYTLNKCGVHIRKELDMVDESGYYYNPMSREHPYKRITLLPEVITEDTKITLKKLFGKIMDELNYREANEFLVKTCRKESNNVSKLTTRSMSATIASGAKSSNPAEIRQILIYPPGKGGIPINTEDYMCLAQDQYLNDVIIDFYLKHLVHDVLTHSQREKTHIFSTFFYKRLTTKPSKVNKNANPHEWDSNLTPAQKRHARVKTWTKNVNIFEKDFIVVPINVNCHWFVAIICYPSLEGCRSMIDNRAVVPQQIKKRERRSSMQIGSTTITPLTKQEQLTLSCDSDNLSERDEESDLDLQWGTDDEEQEKRPPEKKPEIPVVRKNEPIKQPCILIFDSLAGASRSRVVATLRDYLTCEHLAKTSKSKIYNKDNIKGSCPKIPQQNNSTDCGLYLLQYVEQFFKDPVMDYTLPIKQLANWFDEITVTRKREEISNLLKSLMHKFNPDSHLALPDITFPTLNGKLIETVNIQQEDWDKIEEMQEILPSPENPIGPIDDKDCTVNNPRRSLRNKQLNISEPPNDVSLHKKSDNIFKMNSDKMTDKIGNDLKNIKRTKKKFSEINKKNRKKLNVSIEMCKKANLAAKIGGQSNSQQQIYNNTSEITATDEALTENTDFNNQTNTDNVQNMPIIATNTCNIILNELKNKHFQGIKQKSLDLQSKTKENIEQINENGTLSKVSFFKRGPLETTFIDTNSTHVINVSNPIVNNPDRVNTDDIEITIKIGKLMTNICVQKKENDAQLKINTDREIQTSLDNCEMEHNHNMRSLGNDTNTQQIVTAADNNVVEAHRDNPVSTQYRIPKVQEKSLSTKKNTSSADTSIAHIEITESEEREFANHIENVPLLKNQDNNESKILSKSDFTSKSNNSENVTFINKQDKSTHNLLSQFDCSSKTVAPPLGPEEVEFFDGESVKEGNIQPVKSAKNTRSAILMPTIKSKSSSQKRNNKRGLDTSKTDLSNKKMRLKRNY